jgi:hypothetical protein
MAGAAGGRQGAGPAHEWPSRLQKACSAGTGSGDQWESVHAAFSGAEVRESQRRRARTGQRSGSCVVWGESRRADAWGR